MPNNYDLAIINAKIIDGTGNPAINGNVYINNDSIAFIGELNHEKIIIKQIIDAKEQILSPGFIDLHSHGNPLKTPEFENFLAMGVTTISLGQDGSSPNEMDLGSYIEKVDQKNLGPNIVQFIGHGTIRNLSGIGIKKNSSKKEFDKMISILDQNLKYCFGMSTGLEYTPGLFAGEDELIELAKIIGNNNRIIMSHMRNEDDDELFNSIIELAKQGEYSRVHISHLKSVYGQGEERAFEILDLIKDLQNKGIPITADIYPYIASYTGIAIVFPDWSKSNEQFELAKKTRKEELETYIKNKVNYRNGPEATLFGTAPYTGKTLAQVAKKLNKPFEKFLVDDLGPQGTSAAYFVMNKDLQYTLLEDPVIGIGSDGSLTGSHPRGHGTFAKVIEEFVVKNKLISLEEAIRKMTSYPAEILNLNNRGVIKIGNKADLIIFDPLKVKAKADYADPHQLAQGIEIVIINGKVARNNGKLSLDLSGRVLIPKKNKPKF